MSDKDWPDVEITEEQAAEWVEAVFDRNPDGSLTAPKRTASPSGPSPAAGLDPDSLEPMIRDVLINRCSWDDDAGHLVIHEDDGFDGVVLDLAHRLSARLSRSGGEAR